MGWDQPFCFHVDPLNSRLAWHLRALRDERGCGSPGAAAPGRAGAENRYSGKTDIGERGSKETAFNAVGSGRRRFQTGKSGQNQFSDQGKRSSFHGEFNLP